MLIRGKECPVFYPVLVTYGSAVFYFRGYTNSWVTVEHIFWPEPDDFEVLRNMGDATFIYDCPSFFANLDTTGIYRYEQVIYYPVLPGFPVMSPLPIAWAY